MNTGQSVRPGALIAGLGLSLLIFGFFLYSTRFPEPRPASAPASEFSAERAAAVLEELLAENVPHPVGSFENQRVKGRIISRLESLGIGFEEQQTVGCHSRAPRCGFVENIIARIPGEEDTPAVLLMSHYDSVPFAPGAGDAGSGVAAILEVARILAQEAPFRNPVILLFTDGEEVGLLGAEAFFGQHPLAAEVGVVLNVEGSGTQGESLLLRTGPDSSWVVNAYLRPASHPAAYSVADEVFRRMPNDTDFSVVQRAGLPGLDFSFAGERSHYHTHLDTVENLSRVTLQHHGENLLPLTRELAGMPLTGQPAGDMSFHSYAQVGTLSWKMEHNLYLLVLSYLLLAVGIYFILRNGETSGRGLAIGAMVGLAVLLLVVILNIGVFKLLGGLNGVVVAWPAHPWPFRLSLVAGTLLGLSMVRLLPGRFLEFWPSLLGCWIIWLGLATAAVVYAPAAANLFLIPVVAAGFLLLVLAPWHSLPWRKEWQAILGLATVTFMTLPTAWMLEQTQGYRLVIAVIPFMALYALVLNPLLGVAKVRTGRLLLISMAALGVGMLGAVNVPLYSQWRPQPLNFVTVEEQGQAQSYWIIASTNPYPATLDDVARFAVPDGGVVPWSDSTPVPVAVAPASGLPGPVVRIAEIQEIDQGRRVRLHIESQRRARRVQILVPSSAGLAAVTVAGQEMIVVPSEQEWRRLIIEGVPDEGVELEIQLNSTDASEWFILDRDSRLPPGADVLLEARAPLATPVHTGDESVVYMRFTI